MKIRKTLIAALAMAIAVAFSPLPGLQAAVLFNPGSQPAVEGATHLVKTKKKAKGKRKGKKAKSKASSCGTYMYRSKGKCVDARNKK
jgi:hypothetical protein